MHKSDQKCLAMQEPSTQDIEASILEVPFDEGFSMRATARDFGEGLTLVRVDKPPKEEAVGCWVGPT